jgi:hypothetical protein
MPPVYLQRSKCDARGLVPVVVEYHIATAILIQPVFEVQSTTAREIVETCAQAKDARVFDPEPMPVEVHLADGRIRPKRAFRISSLAVIPGCPAYDTPRASSYVDPDVAAGNTYFYTVRSRDPAGDQHQAAPEVHVTVTDGPTPTSTSTVTATRTATHTLTPSPTTSPTASATPTPTPTVTQASTATAVPTRIPTATPVASSTPCRLFVPAVLLSVRGLHGLVSRTRH